MKRVLVTGATGFVGRTLCGMLRDADYLVRAATRSPEARVAGAEEIVGVGDISAETGWQAALEGVDLVIHAAARAHVVRDAAVNSDLYMSTNTEGTACLARAAAKAAVKRFVYLSTIKVNGEENQGRPYTAEDLPDPKDAYGASKWLAEKSLAQVALLTRMPMVIVRLPLVYGPGVRANFYRLMRWVDKQWPLPLGSIDNRRSLVSIWNLSDFLISTLENPAAIGNTWMVSDAEDLSTPELIRRIAAAMHRRARLIKIPPVLLRASGSLTGHGGEVRRLCGSLTVDISLTRTALRWSPPLSVDEGLSRTVEWYLAEGRR